MNANTALRRYSEILDYHNVDAATQQMEQEQQFNGQ